MRSPHALALLPLLGCSLLGGAGFETSDATIEQRGAFGIGGSEAHCRVKNLGNSPAPATVTFSVKTSDGTTMSADEYVMLQPKEPKVVDHAFYTINLAAKGDATVTCKAVAAK